MNWYVVYTKPKWEKKVAEQLSNLGIECYCPLILKVRQWSDRKKKIEIPLFNSYVFVKLEESDRNLVFQSAGTVRYLFWLGKPAVVKDGEIETIKNWLENPKGINHSVTAYKIGDKIKIESGPFIDQEAIVQKINRNNCVLVLESIGCILKMDLI